MTNSNFAIFIPNELKGSWVIDEQGNETIPNAENLTKIYLFQSWDDAYQLTEYKKWVNPSIVELTFDVVLHDNENSDKMGLSLSIESCKWIIENKNSDMFKDYIVGIAQIKCNEIETPDEAFFQKSI